MICPECNLLIPEDSRFCKECGKKLEASVEEQEALTNQEKAERLYREGISLYHQGLFDDALTRWEETLELVPDFQMTSYYMGVAYYDKGMLSAAMESFKKAEAANPTSPAIHYRLGMTYYSMGRSEVSSRTLPRSTTGWLFSTRKTLILTKPLTN
jgi:tetratricopeptide (TPR) repeat protein